MIDFIRNLYEVSSPVMRESWFWHFWIAGLIVFFAGWSVGKLWIIVSRLVWIGFLLREIGDFIFHFSASDMPVLHWVGDGVAARRCFQPQLLDCFHLV